MQPKDCRRNGPHGHGQDPPGHRARAAPVGEIVSGDSMQIYRGMDIGTAKPTPDELAAAPHHLIDAAEPGEEWSVSRYVEAADAAVQGILARGKLPIVVGGTGLYIDSLVRGAGFPERSGEDGICRARA